MGEHELVAAFLFGAVSGGVLSASYAGFAIMRRRGWQMRAKPYRYFRLRPER